MVSFEKRAHQKETGSVDLVAPVESTESLNAESYAKIKIPPEILQESVALLKKIESDPAAFIDEGGAATVYRLPSGGLCMKVLKPHKLNSATNFDTQSVSLPEEAEFLQRVSRLERDGVRAPRYLSHMQSQNFSTMLMEELDAINLQHVLNDTAELPATFDHNKFFAALETYIQALNEELLIIHGDLEARNIMVDRKTGLPRVIDFGRSVDLREANEERIAKFKNQDWDTLEKVEDALYKHQRGALDND